VLAASLLIIGSKRKAAALSAASSFVAHAATAARLPLQSLIGVKGKLA